MSPRPQHHSRICRSLEQPFRFLLGSRRRGLRHSSTRHRLLRHERRPILGRHHIRNGQRGSRSGRTSRHGRIGRRGQRQSRSIELWEPNSRSTVRPDGLPVRKGYASSSTRIPLPPFIEILVTFLFGAFEFTVTEIVEQGCELLYFGDGAGASHEAWEERLLELIVLDGSSIRGVADEEERFLICLDLLTDGMGNGSSGHEKAGSANMSHGDGDGKEKVYIMETHT